MKFKLAMFSFLFTTSVSSDWFASQSPGFPVSLVFFCFPFLFSFSLFFLSFFLNNGKFSFVSQIISLAVPFAVLFSILSNSHSFPTTINFNLSRYFCFVCFIYYFIHSSHSFFTFLSHNIVFFLFSSSLSLH